MPLGVLAPIGAMHCLGAKDLGRQRASVLNCVKVPRMCGILGFVGAPNSLSEERWTHAQRVQGHRGPDDSGCRIVNVGEHEIRLAHQRLAILDLTPAGHQPMGVLASNGLLIFNGEIYNFRELRDELKADGQTFESRADTEVLLQALAHWGPDKTVNRLNGMWAFAWLEPGGLPGGGGSRYGTGGLDSQYCRSRDVSTVSESHRSPAKQDV